MCNCNKDFKIIYLGEDLVTENKKKITETLPITIDLKDYFSDYLNMPDQDVLVSFEYEQTTLDLVQISLAGGNFYVKYNGNPPVLIPNAEYTFIPDYEKYTYNEEVNVKFHYLVDAEICNYPIVMERMFNIEETDCGKIIIDIPEEGNIDVTSLVVEVFNVEGTLVETFNYVDKNDFSFANDYVSFRITNGTYVKNYNQISLCKITNCYIKHLQDHFCSECFEPCKDDCNETENDIRRYTLNRLNSIMFAAMNYGMFFNETYKYLDLHSIVTEYFTKYQLFAELRDLVIKCNGCDDAINNPTEECKPCKDC